MPRGRPKKDVVNDNLQKCERCNNKSKIPLVRINTEQISGTASFHRDSPKTFNLCYNCCKDLSFLIDNWFIDGGGEPKHYCRKV